MSFTKTILYIEDDVDVATMLQIMFRDDPINMVIAPTGAEGLEKARELTPDLIVLDLILPDMTGRDVFLQLQADVQLKDIPVWVLSVHWWKADGFPWYAPSVVSYTFKPFKPYRFRERVLHWLRLEPQTSAP